MNETEMINQQMSQETCPYLTIRDFAKKHEGWTESSLRWLIYNNTANFNEIVVRRIGSKILISVRDFWDWIEQQNPNKKLRV